MCCLLSATRSLGFILCTTWSRKRYSPVQSPSSMPSTASSVDFPAPDGPMIETNSPAAISTETCRRMNRRPFPWETDLSRFLIWIIRTSGPPSEHCIHLGLRCSGVRDRVPGVRGTRRHLTPGTRHLFVPQRLHRIDPRGAVSRDPAGHERGREEHE